MRRLSPRSAPADRVTEWQGARRCVRPAEPERIDKVLIDATVQAGSLPGGYVTLTVDDKNISGTLTLTDPPGSKPSRDVDTFSYPAGAIILPQNEVVSL